jgi:phosphocarrier protein
MKKVHKKITILNKQGLHARPATVFVQTAKKFKSRVSVIKDKKEVDGKSIMGILTLGAGQGSEITLKIEGEDAENAFLALELILVKDREKK